MIAEKSSSIYTIPFWLLCSSNFLFSASFSMIIPELPDYLASMGGKEYIGFIISLFTLTAGLSRPFSGKLTDHVGRVPIMALGSIVCFIISGFYTVVHSVWGFLLLRFLHGMSTGTKPTATAAYVADVIPEDRRGEAQGTLGIFTATGMSIGPAIGGFLANSFGLDPMFYISGLFALLSILILLKLEETLPPTMKRKFSLKLLKINWSDVFEPKVAPVFWIMLLVSFSSGAVLTLVPDISKSVGINNKGLYFSIYTIASIVVRIFFSKSSDKYGRIPVLIYSCISLAIGMFLLVSNPTPIALILSAIFYGISWGFNTPTLAAWTNDLGDAKHMGRAMATMYIALEAGIGIGAYISGYIYQGDLLKTPLPFLLSGLLALLSLIVLKLNASNWTLK
ncbi:MFS transporter [Sandaracinomonas limnophila]|uniref:MFS transporter n=1 Tax=Sandaracinomonas limnophila TaxID=1862386 RepID=A0A437PX62_9BACT|nr:MFS transporter [Sandaracinomonas limnophila]RVU26854.1 MFS transporter [Sandaracinomonas limnophila]